MQEATIFKFMTAVEAVSCWFEGVATRPPMYCRNDHCNMSWDFQSHPLLLSNPTGTGMLAHVPLVFFAAFAFEGVLDCTRLESFSNAQAKSRQDVFWFRSCQAWFPSASMWVRLCIWMAATTTRSGCCSHVCAWYKEQWADAR